MGSALKRAAQEGGARESARARLHCLAPDLHPRNELINSVGRDELLPVSIGSEGVSETSAAPYEEVLVLVVDLRVHSAPEPWKWEDIANATV